MLPAGSPGGSRFSPRSWNGGCDGRVLRPGGELLHAYHAVALWIEALGPARASVVAGARELCAAHLGAAQVRAAQVGLPQFRARQVAAPQRGALQIGPVE